MEVQSCSQGVLIFFLLSFGFKVGRLEERFFFSSRIWCGEVENGLSSVRTGHWTFRASFIGGGVRGEDLFSFQLIGRAKVPILFCLHNNGRWWGVARRGDERFFFCFPCFLMCSHGVPSKFLMGFRNVPQVHNVFPNMFSV